MSQVHGIVGTDRVDVLTGGVPPVRDGTVIVSPAYHPFARTDGRTARAQHALIILNRGHRPQRKTVQIYLIQIILPLFGKVPVPVHKSGQHAFSLQVDDTARRPEVSSLPGFFRRSREKYPPAARGHGLHRAGGVRVRRLTGRFRHGVYDTVVIQGVDRHFG